MQLCSAGEEKSKKEMACSCDDSKVYSDMPLKRTHLPSSLCWVMRGGEHGELLGNLKLGMGVGWGRSSAFTTEQSSLSLSCRKAVVLDGPPAGFYPGGKMCLDIGLSAF